MRLSKHSLDPFRTCIHLEAHCPLPLDEGEGGTGGIIRDQVSVGRMFTCVVVGSIGVELEEDASFRVEVQHQ